MAPRLPPSLERASARAILSLPPAVLRRLAGPPRRSAEGCVLDLQLQALLRLIEVLRVPPVLEGTVEQARRALDRSGPTLDFAPRADVSCLDRTVAGAGGPRRARVYTPRSGGAEGRRAALVYFHGGGWVVGSIESHDCVCRTLAAESGAVVVSVDYRLAPEHPFPCGVDDAVAATRAILSDARDWGVDAARVAVGGDSAGGNLAAVVAQSLRDDALRPAFQLLVYPGVDMTRSLPSHAQFVEGFFLSKASCDVYVERYLGAAGDPRDPRASPLFAKDLARLPPALVLTAGFDPLRDEGRAYAEAMRAAGAKVEHVCAEGLTHGFFNLGGAIGEAARMVHLAAAGLRRAVAPAS